MKGRKYELAVPFERSGARPAAANDIFSGSAARAVLKHAIDAAPETDAVAEAREDEAWRRNLQRQAGQIDETGNEKFAGDHKHKLHTPASGKPDAEKGNGGFEKQHPKCEKTYNT